mgnify:CR=1 FL=1
MKACVCVTSTNLECVKNVVEMRENMERIKKIINVKNPYLLGLREYNITKIMCTNKELYFKHIKYLALKADKITGIIFHLYKINLLIDNTGYKDYNK